MQDLMECKPEDVPIDHGLAMRGPFGGQGADKFVGLLMVGPGIASEFESPGMDILGSASLSKNIHHTFQFRDIEIRGRPKYIMFYCQSVSKGHICV